MPYEFEYPFYYDLPAEIATGSMSSVTATSATALGDIISVGEGASQFGVTWTTAGIPDITTDPHTKEGTAKVGLFVTNIGVLTGGTVYLVRHYMTTDAGATLYGGVIEIETRERIPSITKPMPSRKQTQTMQDAGVRWAF